jgi:hypothetical protein
MQHVKISFLFLLLTINSYLFPMEDGRGVSTYGQDQSSCKLVSSTIVEFMLQYCAIA